MYAPTRDQARRFMFDAWRKFQAGESLSSLERIVLDVVLMHPEYRPVLENPQRHADQDYGPEGGGVNPFLHLGLHVAIEEQLSIDQPPGIRAEFERLRAARSDEHEAKHDLLECLGETLWQSQRSGAPLDAAGYLDCLRRRA